MKRSNPFFDEELLREATLRVKTVERTADNSQQQENWRVDMLECTRLHIGRLFLT